MATPRPPAKLLVDTSSAIGLLEGSGRDDLLDKLVGLGFEIAFPPAVWLELGDGPTTIFLRSKSHITSFDPPTAKVDEFRAHYPLLGRGELAVLAQGAGASGIVCVLDDKRARTAAGAHAIPFTGTLGLLGVLVDGKAITSAERDEIVASLRTSGFFLPASA